MFIFFTPSKNKTKTKNAAFGSGSPQPPRGNTLFYSFYGSRAAAFSAPYGTHEPKNKNREKMPAE